MPGWYSPVCTYNEPRQAGAQEVPNGDMKLFHQSLRAIVKRQRKGASKRLQSWDVESAVGR